MMAPATMDDRATSCSWLKLIVSDDLGQEHGAVPRRRCWSRHAPPPPPGRWGGSGQPLAEMLADTDGVRHGGQCGIDRTDAWEEARVHDVEVVDFVSLA